MRICSRQVVRSLSRHREVQWALPHLFLENRCLRSKFRIHFLSMSIRIPCSRVYLFAGAKKASRSSCSVFALREARLNATHSDPNCRLKLDMNTHSKVCKPSGKVIEELSQMKRKRNHSSSCSFPWALLNTEYLIACSHFLSFSRCGGNHANFRKGNRSRIWNKRAMTCRDKGKLGKTIRPYLQYGNDFPWAIGNFCAFRHPTGAFVPLRLSHTYPKLISIVADPKRLAFIHLEHHPGCQDRKSARFSQIG